MSDHNHNTENFTPSSAQQQQQQQQNLHSSSSQNHNSAGGLFFADATLDLDEAHDIAETPEPPRRFLQVDSQKQAATLRLPQLDLAVDHPASTSSSTGPQNRSRSNSLANSRSTSPIRQQTAPASAPPSIPPEPEAPDSSKTLSGPMNRITSSHIGTSGNMAATRGVRTPPRWPRDLPWAIAFCVVVPISLLWPSWLWHRHQIFYPGYHTTPLVLPLLRHVTFWSMLFAYAASLLIARGMYRTPGGGEGEETRFKASQFLLACVPVSVAVNVILILEVYLLLPRALIYAAIPFWYFLRDIYLYRKWKLQGGGGEGPPTSPRGSTPNNTRHAFFQALTCMALDILSRSLRRNSFHRCIVTLLTLQVIVTVFWRWAIMGALNAGNPLIVILALIGGKWATGTIARLLSLVSSGGIASWFGENSAMVEEQEMQERNSRLENGQANGDNKAEEEEQGYDTSGIPEEYRTADASIYQSVVDFDDEGMDDDDEDDFEYGFTSSRSGRNQDDDYNYYDRTIPQQNSTTPAGRATVKSFFVSGITVSFGSVAQCGLLGGPAQFVWCQLRKVDATRHAIVNRLQQQSRDFRPNRAVNFVAGVTGAHANGGFRGMQIGQDEGTSILHKLLNRANVIARKFVREHSDLAMSHVAAYYKSYKRAALDVSQLVEEAGKLFYFCCAVCYVLFKKAARLMLTRLL